MLLFLLLSLSSFAAEPSSPGPSLSELNDCNWMVTYRGRTYDLSPLTREALARPIEGDLRYAIQRVPTAAKHLESMQSNLQHARVSTFMASAFLGAFVVAKIFASSAKSENAKEDYDIAMLASGAFFLRATFASWTSTRTAKKELVDSLAAFNNESPHKIAPYSPPVEHLAP